MKTLMLGSTIAWLLAGCYLSDTAKAVESQLSAPPPEYADKKVFVCEDHGAITNVVLMVKKIDSYANGVWVFTLDIKTPTPPKAIYRQVEGETCFTELLPFGTYFMMIHPDTQPEANFK
jgi:hypothetical protein